MKIKQIGNYNGDIIQTILKNRQIEDVELFLNPTNKDDLMPFSLTNMQVGAETVLAHLLVDSHIGLLVDPDADGFSSSSIIYQYMKTVKPDANITYFLHDSKSHGLTEKIVDQISDSHIDLIIIPDAASNDVDEIQKLYYMGIDIVIIDHHEIDKMPQHGILINNQLGTNMKTNKNLVGAGMSFKFCQAMDILIGQFYSDNLLDLVAIGQVGDSSDTSENEVRNLVFRGLKDINNPFVRVVLQDKFDDLEKIAPKDLSFSIIPLINSVVRVGTMEEKDLLFRALNQINGHVIYTVTKKKKNKDTGKFDQIKVDQSFYEYAYDACKKVKARQDTMVKKTMAKMSKKIDDSGGIVIGILPTSNERSIAGLVANNISRKLQKPTLLVHYIKNENEETGEYVGSGRGFEKVLPSLKDWCNETGLVQFAQGHANAFGISIFEENFDEFKKKTHEVQAQEFVYEVDILSDKVEKEAIIDVVKNKHFFGGKVFEPLFAFTGIKVRKDFIRQRGSMLTFYDNDIEFVMYGAPDGLFEELTHNFDQYIPMDFVGRPSHNSYSGKTTYQLVLEDCERNKVENPEPAEITAETLVF